MPYQPRNNRNIQRSANGGRCSSPDKPLLGTFEKRIAKCEKNLEYLKAISGPFEKQDVELLVSYYENRRAYYQNKIDTAHSWLLDVESPQTL